MHDCQKVSDTFFGHPPSFVTILRNLLPVLAPLRGGSVPFPFARGALNFFLPPFSAPCLYSWPFIDPPRPRSLLESPSLFRIAGPSTFAKPVTGNQMRHAKSDKGLPPWRKGRISATDSENSRKSNPTNGTEHERQKGNPGNRPTRAPNPDKVLTQF